MQDTGNGAQGDLDLLVGVQLDSDMLRALVASAVIGLGDQKVGDRSGRVEPRAVKRRPKPTPLLTMPLEIEAASAQASR